MRKVTVFVCTPCNIMAASMPNHGVCPTCQRVMEMVEVAEVETEHPHIRRVEERET